MTDVGSHAAGSHGADADILHFRGITPAEIAHYKQHGWARLDKFLPPGVTARMLAYAKARMGEDGTISATPGKFDYFNALPVMGLGKPVFDDVLRHFARTAVDVRNLRKTAGARYFLDFFGVKLPVAQTEGHGKSDWHQDFAAQVSDRSGGMVFWTALVDLTPEHGTMAYLSGSHREGVMGDYRTYGNGNLLDVYPELADTCPSSGLQTLAAGDVVIHSDLTVHMAGPNTSGEPRWTYLAIMNPADARWTGGPAVSFDTAGLTHLGMLDEERFPRLA
ncbi:phytanoyl-CoA dioxygenase [Novosphingobium sp. FSY-8]|uniref:Phytanoyl-CoA dioxygenase n=1 Tax=Novosphingobium ovatum TaxID=1908523 RepID=A0ABW9XFX0_9SPHN|nr:phytanoyl-CoA dioxygenase family protein [Novosphingobium ovatum]NBC37411.1 phytanoyl-CoA dioxygenase [Novosphingobium ovatum]